VTKRLCDICTVEIISTWYRATITRESPKPEVTEAKADEICGQCMDRVKSAMRRAVPQSTSARAS